MEKPPQPINEGARLLALERVGILDTSEERSFDAITRVAADHYDCSVSLITFVDAHRQWFKSCFGWDVRETSRELSFCAHAIARSSPLVVTDAREDERFRDNRLVTGAPFIRFYAGVPLSTSDGYNLGTLCVIDDKPRPDIGPVQLSVLEDLAEVIVEKLELRLQNAQTYEERKRLEGLVGASQDALLACDLAGSITFVNPAAERLLALDRKALTGGGMRELEHRLVSSDGLPLDARQAPATFVLAEGTELPPSTFGLQRDDGSLRWVRIQARPLWNAHGEVTGAALSLQEYNGFDGLVHVDPSS